MANLYLGSRKFVPAFYNDEGGSATLITKSITQNGTYNASSDNADGYSSVTVNVAGGGGYSELPSYQVSNGVASRRNHTLTDNEFSGITSVDDFGLYFAFISCHDLTGALDLSSLMSVGECGLYGAFSDCQGLTSVNLSSLMSVGESGLDGAFSGCENLTSINLSSLTNIGFGGLSNTFTACYSLTSVDFPSLTSIGGNGLSTTFTATMIEHIYFRALTSDSFEDDTVFDMMLMDAHDATVHFPSNLQAVIGNWQSVLDGFGGVETTVLFDLPATE